MQKYPQVEAINHVHTGGNSSGIVDGAAAVLIGSEEFGRADRPASRGRASWPSPRSAASRPIMLTAPARVTDKLLKRCGMAKADIDLFEINEAFAASCCGTCASSTSTRAKVNVNGGAIALGHPLGATGAMILGTVLDELERRDLNTALVTLCAGNGLGTATIIERV